MNCESSGHDFISNSVSEVNNINSLEDNLNNQNELTAGCFEILDDLQDTSNESICSKKTVPLENDYPKTKIDYENMLLHEDRGECELNTSDVSITRKNLEVNGALCNSIYTLSSFINMEEQQFLYLKSILDGLKKNSNLEEVKLNCIESNSKTSDNVGLLESESSSSLLVFDTNKSNDSFDSESKNEILNKKTEFSIEESNTVVTLHNKVSNESDPEYQENSEKNELQIDEEIKDIEKGNDLINPEWQTTKNSTIAEKSYKQIKCLGLNLVEEKVNNLESNCKTSDNVGLLEFESLSLPVFDTNKSNDNFDFKSKNESLVSKHEISKKTECSTEESNPVVSLHDNEPSDDIIILEYPESLKKNELQIDKENKDYLEKEKDDLTNPEWQTIKNLSTDEERYQQIRNCWGSRKIPNPNKNLTYHSYRKRWFNSKHPESKIVTQHKRQAPTQLNENSAKRRCTFFLDEKINTMERNKEKKKQEIINEMHNKIKSIYEFGPMWGSEAYHQFCARASVISEYNRIVDSCEFNFIDRIWSLNEHRNEVLQFYGFYKGLDISNEDPTQLTEAQFQELDEIEEVYRQFDIYYH